jgi:transposase
VHPRGAAGGSNSGCREKKSLHARERDTPRVERLRARWRQKRRGLDPQQLIFVDESGLNLALTRRYARAPRGVRAVGSVPQNQGQNLTVLAALNGGGIEAALVVPGATDREVFLSFLQQVLGPQLKPGVVVVMDNLAAHKNPEVAEAIQKRGAQLCYLPPYSPDYNPIEQAWSKIKTFLRGIGARTYRKLSRSLKAVLAQVISQDTQAWFAHCGYPVTVT